MKLLAIIVTFALLWAEHSLITIAVAAAHACSTVAGSDIQKPIAAHSFPSSPLDEEFAKFVRESLDIWHVPGMSVGVVDGDNVYTEGYGYAIIPDVPATADTLWYTCSTTKAQVAALLSQLIHSDNYSSIFPRGWETPISSIIRDDFVLQDEWATAHVTLNDAVSHRSGLNSHDLGLLRVRDGKQLLPREVTRNLRHLAIMNEPRVRWSYCNYMYVALGHVLETVMGQWLGQALREHLWTPLGMHSTFFDVDDALAAPYQHLAAGYVWEEAARNYTRLDYMTLTDFSAAGAVISNVKDYVKWMKCLMDKSAPLSKSTHLDMQKPRMLLDKNDGAKGDDMAPTLYGLGWVHIMIHGQIVFYHPGGFHAYGAELFWLPHVRFGVVTFGNTVASSNWQQLDVIYRLIEDRLEIPASKRINIRQISMQARAEVLTRNKALDRVFPNRPESPLPSSFSITQLVGNYTNSGWGHVTFTEEPDDQGTGKSLLVGPRPHASFRHTFVLEHVTGDHWLLTVVEDGGSPYRKRFFAARFVAGVDGEPACMELDTAKGPSDPGDGVIVFTRSP